MRPMAFAPLGHAAAALLCATVLAVACDSPSDPDSREPAAIAVVAGAGQQGTAGQELAVPIAVKVTDDRGRPVAGQVVTFHVTSGGGGVFSGTATTNAEGIAQERWTMGTNAALPQALEARVVDGGGATLTAVVTATLVSAPASRLDRVTPGDILTGVINSQLADSLAVRVTDAFGNPVPGASVSWAATSGSGSVTAATSQADASGIARTAWRLGPVGDAYQSASATVGGATVSFYARAGSSFFAIQGTGITVSPGATFRVAAALNDWIGPVPGVPVQWQVTSGGGSVTPAVSKTGGPEDPGIAAAQWTVGPTPGTQTLTATAGTLTATFTVTVFGSVTRTFMAQIPGTVLDASPDYVLWLDQSGAAPVFKRRLLSGADQTIDVSPGTGQLYNVNGWLFDGGALVRNQTGSLFAWHHDRGFTLPLGVAEAPPSVEGSWAAWRASPTEVVRHHLPTSSTLRLAAANATSVDVGADGDVVWLSSGTPWHYRDGAATPITTQGDGSVIRVETDGTSVVYLKADAFVSHYLWLENGGSDLLLASHGSTAGAAIHYRLNGGWIAWNTPLRAVFRRSPGGAVEQVTTETTALQVVALASDGTLVYEDRARGRYFLVTPAGDRLDAGPTAGTQYFARGSSIFAVLAGAVYRVTA